MIAAALLLADLKNVYPSPILEMGSTALIIFLILRKPYLRWKERIRQREVDQIMKSFKKHAIYVGPITPEMKAAMKINQKPSS